MRNKNIYFLNLIFTRYQWASRKIIVFEDSNAGLNRKRESLVSFYRDGLEREENVSERRNCNVMGKGGCEMGKL